jgi:hypothetical protein
MAIPINDPRITWATYKVGLYPVFASAQAGRDAVQTERRLELAMEGQRLFDRGAMERLPLPSPDTSEERAADERTREGSTRRRRSCQLLGIVGMQSRSIRSS